MRDNLCSARDRLDGTISNSFKIFLASLMYMPRFSTVMASLCLCPFYIWEPFQLGLLDIGGTAEGVVLVISQACFKRRLILCHPNVAYPFPFLGSDKLLILLLKVIKHSQDLVLQGELVLQRGIKAITPYCYLGQAYLIERRGRSLCRALKNCTHRVRGASTLTTAFILRQAVGTFLPG